MKTASKNTFDWTVIGAGPAGIAAMGKLLDQGIHPHNIAWIDPYFKVGDFGAQWHPVSSNTKVKRFTQFLLACKSFNYSEIANDFLLNQLDADKTCLLSFMVEPLQRITEQFKEKVICLQDFANKIHREQQQWSIQLSQALINSKKVILATGAEPKTLDYSALKHITLAQALDKNQLPQICNQEDTVALFGSSHSAIIAIRHLLACNVKEVVNFYRNPLRYAVDQGDWILYDDTGLKGTTATWARENMDGNLPARLSRFLATDETIQQQLPRCNKAVYAIGFAPRNSLIIDGFTPSAYNKYNGMIAPGLFGLGIAFPEENIDRLGNLEYRVGLWKFMDYLNRVMPVWLEGR